MSITRITMISCLMLLPACAGGKHYTFQSTLDESEIAWSRESGRNTVIGRAYETSPAGFHSCSGTGVSAIPDSAYARERLGALYGNIDKGYRERPDQNDVFIDEPPAYKDSWKTTYCDGKGNFVFPNLPNGTYYIVAPVSWQLSDKPNAYEGGYHIQKITLSGGRTIRLKDFTR